MFVNTVKVYCEIVHFWYELPAFDVCHVEHPLAGDRLRFVLMFVREINHFRDSGLNDDFGAFVAWEQSNVNHTILNVGRVLIQYPINSNT